MVSPTIGGYNFQRGKPIAIALVNNMPDAAWQATERQFCDLLSVAARDHSICLRFFSLTGHVRAREAQPYEKIDELWKTRIDGLIVTGTEPHAAVLVEEPYWSALARLIEWAEDHTISAIWSCLAAHAAVFHTDGVSRRPLCEKLFGLFECTKVSDHPIIRGAPSRWHVPHSRYNEVPEEALAACGYRVLSRSTAAGADIFVKQGKSLFVFLQGHPEYDGQALLREYRREIRRFLVGERNSYPELPRGYFDDTMARALAKLKARALLERDAAVLQDFPAVLAEAKPAWSKLALCLYTNWVTYLAEQKCSDRVGAVK